MKFINLLLFSLFVFGFLFPVDCLPGFSVKQKVRVLDAFGRPVEGADVSVYYQLSDTFPVLGKTHIWSANQTTDKEGMATLGITNKEQMINRLDCRLIFAAYFQGTQNTKEINVDALPPILDIYLDLIRLTLSVVDQNNVPVSNATVFINGKRYITNPQGKVISLVPLENVNITIVHRGGTKTEFLPVLEKRDQEMTLIFPLYDLKLRIIDDDGNPIKAEVEVEQWKKTTDEKGIAFFEKIAKTIPRIKVNYMGLSRDVSINLEIEREKTIAFDVHPPKIKEIRPIQLEGYTQLVIKVEDPGDYASGIDPSKAVVRYRTKNTDWEGVPLYLSGKNEFTAEIPRQKEGELVYFSITFSDRQGNSVSKEGYYYSKVVEEENVKNQSTKEGEKPEKKEEKKEENKDNAGLLLPLFFVILIIIIGFFAFKMLKNHKEGSISDKNSQDFEKFEGEKDFEKGF